MIGRSIINWSGYLCSYFAFYYLPIGTAYFIFYGGSLISGYIWGAWLLKENLSKVKIRALILSTSWNSFTFIETIWTR